MACHRPSARGRTRKARYTLPGAAQARTDMVRELTRHGFALLAAAYRAGRLRERDLVRLLGHEAWLAEQDGDPDRQKMAEGIALLAAFLHEGKHTRPASACGVRLYWQHVGRVHPERRS